MASFSTVEGKSKRKKKLQGLDKKPVKHDMYDAFRPTEEEVRKHTTRIFSHSLS